MEIWKSIDEFNKIYEISNYGRIRKNITEEYLNKNGYSYDKTARTKNRYVVYFKFNGSERKRIGRFYTKEEAVKFYKEYVKNFNMGYKLMKSRIEKGYYRVILTKNKKKVHKSIHRLVAEAFIPNPKNKSQVNHKDGNKLNNNDWNLEWATEKENTQHAHDIGLAKPHNRKTIMCLDNKMIFESSYKAAEWINNKYFGNTKKISVIANKIRCCCNNKQKIAYNHRWKFID